jgi:hypothetical protein
MTLMNCWALHPYSGDVRFAFLEGTSVINGSLQPIEENVLIATLSAHKRFILNPVSSSLMLPFYAVESTHCQRPNCAQDKNILRLAVLIG